MSEKVVGLRADVALCGEPSLNVVEYCENLLAMARSGKIRSLGVVYVDTQAYVGIGYVTSGFPHAPHLVAGCTILLDRCKEDWTDV